jgi:hypothetical protein
MEKKFEYAWDVDSHRFELEKNKEFIYRLVSLLLIKEKEYNPEMYVSQLHPDTQNLIVDLGNMLYKDEMEMNKDQNT